MRPGVSQFRRTLEVQLSGIWATPLFVSCLHWALCARWTLENVAAEAVCGLSPALRHLEAQLADLAPRRLVGR